MSIKDKEQSIQKAIQQSHGDSGESPKLNTKTKYRAFAVILYDDCIEHIQMKNYIETRKYYQYVLIKHDRDYWIETDDEVQNGTHYAGEPKKPHYHLIWKTKTPQTLQSQINYFGTFVKMIVGINSIDSYVRYMIHDTPASLKKAHYDFTELTGSTSIINSALADTSDRQASNLGSMFDVLKKNGGDITSLISYIMTTGQYKSEELMEVLARYQGIICQVSRRENALYDKNSTEHKLKNEREKLFYERMTEVILNNHYQDAKNIINKEYQNVSNI